MAIEVGWVLSDCCRCSARSRSLSAPGVGEPVAAVAGVRRAPCWSAWPSSCWIAEPTLCSDWLTDASVLAALSGVDTLAPGDRLTTGPPRLRFCGDRLTSGPLAVAKLTAPLRLPSIRFWPPTLAFFTTPWIWLSREENWFSRLVDVAEVVAPVEGWAAAVAVCCNCCSRSLIDLAAELAASEAEAPCARLLVSS